MRKLIICIILVLCLPLVYGKTLVMYSGDSTTFEGYNIYMGISSGASTLLFRVDADQNFMSTGLTAQQYNEYASSANQVLSRDTRIRSGNVVIELLEICFDISKNDCGRVATGGIHIEPGFKVRLSYEQPELVVQRTYSKSSVFIGEEIEVTVTLENRGSVAAEHIRYEDVYPSTVRINPIAPARLEANSIVYTSPRIAPGEKKEFRYTIYLTDTITTSLRGAYRYYYQGTQFEDLTRAANINLKPTHTSSLTIQPGTIRLDQNANGVLTIRNQADGPITVNGTVHVPSEFGRSFQFSETILEGADITKEIPLRGTISGSHSISAVIDSRYLIQNPTETISRSFTVQSDKLNVQLMPRDRHILVNEQVPTQVFFSKPRDRIARNIAVTVDAFGETYSVNLPELTRESHSERITLIGPSVNETTKFTLHVTGTYVLVGDRQTQETIDEKLEVTVYPLHEALEIQHQLQPTQVEQGQTALMIVRVRNKLEGRGFTGLFAEDFVPESFIHRPIITEASFFIAPGETKQVYSYELRAPFLVNSSRLTTRLQVQEFHLERSSDLSTFVSIRKPTVSVTSSMDRNLFVGGISRNTIRIQNSGNMPVENVQILLPVSEALDLIATERSYFIQRLEPGETVQILRDYRAKRPGVYNLSEILTSYYDEYGNKFDVQVGASELTIAEGANICNINARATASHRNVSILFTQNCIEPISMTYRGETFTLGRGETRVIERTIAANEYTPIFSYSYQGDSYIGSANTVTLVAATPREEEIVIVDEVVADLTPVPENTQIFLSPSGRLHFLIPAAIILLVVLIFISVKPKLKSSRSPDKVPAAGDLPSLKPFIEYKRSKKVPNITIEQELLEVGWDKKVVEAFLR